MKLTALLFAAITLPSIALSAPTVTFQGEITGQTCKAGINGETNSIILLPTASTADLTAPGSTAGLTPFTLTISDCGSAVASITANFLGHNVTAEGNLKNTAANNPAQNVAIQLTQKADGATPIVLNGITQVPGLIPVGTAQSANYQFGARYISTAGGATAGAVTAVVEYSIAYP